MAVAYIAGDSGCEVRKPIATKHESYDGNVSEIELFEHLDHHRALDHQALVMSAELNRIGCLLGDDIVSDDASYSRADQIAQSAGRGGEIEGTRMLPVHVAGPPR
jgi:hypothetical protein